MEIGRVQQVLTADEIFDLVREDLHAVERAIAFESSASDGILAPIANYLHQDGNDRLRATLLLVCARFAGGGGSRMAIQLGAVVEMLHAAALVHDEVMNVQQARRGGPAGVQSANCAIVLAGDWLYLRAFRVALQERVLDLAIGAAQRMVMGEVIQLGRIGRIGITEADCLELADHKTASLFSVCGKLGAIAGEVDTPNAEKLAEYAWNLGMAFQLIDDTLDFVSRESPTRPAGSDLKEGKVTLPLVYALELASASERDMVAGVLRDRSYDAIPFASVLALVARYDGMQRARLRARQFTDRARQIASEFPDSVCRRALFTLIELVNERDCRSLSQNE